MNGYSKNNRESISLVLLGVSAILAVLIVVEVSSFFAASARAGSLLNNTPVLAKPNEQQMQKYLANDKAAADKLKKANLFVPAAPKENPVKEVIGILGNEALISGKWCKVGESIGDAKIVAIEPTRVKVAWNGQESTFTPITSVSSGSSGGPGGPSNSPGRRAGDGPNMVTVSGAGPRGPGQGGGFQMGSPDERARMRDQFANMSEEERQAFRDRMREQFGGDRGGGGGQFGGGRRGGGEGGGGGGGRRGGGG